jgi:hypothetical protein
MVDGGTGLLPENYRRLDCLVDQLIQSLVSPLSVDFLASGHELEDIYGLLVKNLTDLLSAYMALWAFNSKTYAAPKNFKDQMQQVKLALEDFRAKRSQEMP